MGSTGGQQQHHHPADEPPPLLLLCHTQALHPSGSYVVSSSRSGKLSTWQLQGVVAAADAAAAAPPGGSDAALATLDAAAAAVVKHPLLGVEQGGVVDCIRFLAGAWVRRPAARQQRQGSMPAACHACPARLGCRRFPSPCDNCPALAAASHS